MELKRDDPTRLAQNENKIQARTRQSLLINFKQTSARTPQSLVLTNSKQNSSEDIQVASHKLQTKLMRALLANSKQYSSEDTPVAQFCKLKTKFQQGHPSCFELKTQNKIQAKTSQLSLVQVKTKLKEGHLSRLVYPS